MYIDIDSSLKEIQTFLKNLNFLEEDEKVRAIEKPGEGNMNVVLRVQTNKRSFIVKQSRPFVQKYQEIPAPVDRIDVEYQFYANISNDSIRKHIPNVIGYFEKETTLILEDLGDCDDMSFVYENKTISEKQIDTLVSILSAVHASPVTDSYPENKDLRLLNHQHIFILPFLADNGFSLNTIQEGLEGISVHYKNDDTLKEEIKKVGARYLEEGNTLLHGDYYPGSWMLKDDHIYVIDPEFSFKGFAEFDLGVLIAHIIIATVDTTIVSSIKKRYTLPVDEKLVSQMVGIEMMRRLIGLAQLPLHHSLKEKKKLMEFAYLMITE